MWLLSAIFTLMLILHATAHDDRSSLTLELNTRKQVYHEYFTNSVQRMILYMILTRLTFVVSVYIACVNQCLYIVDQIMSRCKGQSHRNGIARSCN